MSMLDHKLEPKPVRRIEVITGTGGRRRFTDDEKAQIIDEALVPGAVVRGGETERSDATTAVHLAAASAKANCGCWHRAAGFRSGSGGERGSGQARTEGAQAR